MRFIANGSVLLCVCLLCIGCGKSNDAEGSGLASLQTQDNQSQNSAENGDSMTTSNGGLESLQTDSTAGTTSASGLELLGTNTGAGSGLSDLQADDNSSAAGDYMKTSSGLMYQVDKEGTGAAAKAGDTVQVHYVGALADGTKFDSSVDRGTPFEFNLGTGSVIAGWDEGVAGMKVGEVRKLIIPPELGYGTRGAPPKIPTNAILVFQIQLLAIK